MGKSLNNSQLRKTYKQIRDNISSDRRDSLSRQIVLNLKALLESDFKRANIFLCFYPFGSEVDLREFYQELLDAGKEVYFPVSSVNEHQLIFKKVRNLSDDFHLGAYDIMEPNDSLEDYDGRDAVVITPGLVFDNSGNRIGYGAGYYDRFFQNNFGAIKIGVCFNEQVTTAIVPGAHDVPMDYIVTDNGILRRKGYDTN